MPLIITPNLPRPDDAYARLIAAHEGLTPDRSAALNARLVLILANHIGNDEVLEQALDLARRAAPG
jgi:hypothetical protein